MCHYFVSLQNAYTNVMVNLKFYGKIMELTSAKLSSCPSHSSSRRSGSSAAGNTPAIFRLCNHIFIGTALASFGCGERVRDEMRERRISSLGALRGLRLPVLVFVSTRQRAARGATPRACLRAIVGQKKKRLQQRTHSLSVRI